MRKAYHDNTLKTIIFQSGHHSSIIRCNPYNTNISMNDYAKVLTKLELAPIDYQHQKHYKYQIRYLT
jgi:hypothetical protein